MPSHHIRCMELDELKLFYKHIMQDFSEGEYAPYPIMYQHLQNRLQTAIILCEGQQDLAYSVCTDNHDNGYVLISLLAVFKEFRNQGLGSEFMDRIHFMYQDKQALLVEVERPDKAETKEERDLREKRIEFYEKVGFFLIKEVDYTIWDIPMHLMALPLGASKETIHNGIKKTMYELYSSLMGETFIHKMHFSD